ncbi:unnamed protein product [Cylindrotheca closterium]|uniref:Uncharacterized protein n=1 Tax=Cylindrotheca closterium TaxID=2856 RepID=A0AAD2CDJ2_9STRA|nr:unnamed protein product [Cylindrotheca closterium]
MTNELPIGESKTTDETMGNSSEKKTAVSFSNIQIREYPIIVGDNPAIMTGTPITIDWEHVEEFDCSIDDYEQAKPKPRNMLELRLPARNRDEILKSQGFSLKDRQVGKKAANTTRRQRRRTSETMNLSIVQESIEKAKRAALNATIYRSRKQKEREFLKEFISKSPSVKPKTIASTDFTNDTVDFTTETVPEGS